MTSRLTPSPYLDTWKDALLEVYLETPNAATGRLEPATGLVDVQLAISATELGGAIGALTGTATERPDTPGQYYLVLDLATLTSDLPSGTYVHDSVVYLQVRKSGDVEVEAFRKRVRRRKY